LFPNSINSFAISAKGVPGLEKGFPLLRSFTGPGVRGAFQVFQEFQGSRIPQLQGAVGCKVLSGGILPGVPAKALEVKKWIPI
jgi:hypothetical protein